MNVTAPDPVHNLQQNSELGPYILLAWGLISSFAVQLMLGVFFFW
jgi:hypothetical protein